MWASLFLPHVRYNSNDDVIKWKHFPRYWPFVRRIDRPPVDSSHKDQWRRAWCFLWSAPEQSVKQIIDTQVVWDAIALIMTSLLCKDSERDLDISEMNRSECDQLGNTCRLVVIIWAIFNSVPSALTSHCNLQRNRVILDEMFGHCNDLQWFDIFSINRNTVDCHRTNVNYIYMTDWNNWTRKLEQD